jgi:hypothetical protein
VSQSNRRVAGEDEGGGLIVLNSLNVWNFELKDPKRANKEGGGE